MDASAPRYGAERATRAASRDGAHPRLIPLFLLRQSAPLAQVAKMLQQDIVHFMAIALAVLVAFSEALRFFFKCSHETVGIQHGATDCLGDLQTRNGFIISFAQSLGVLLQGGSLSDYASEDAVSINFPWVIMALMLIMITLLMVNLLIAMFSKTFDTIHENQLQEYMVLFAMRAEEWADADIARPPLNLLVFPLQALRWCINRLCALALGTRGATESGDGDKTFYAAVEPHFSLNARKFDQVIAFVSKADTVKGDDRDDEQDKQNPIIEYLRTVRGNMASNGVGKHFPGLEGLVPLKLWLKWLEVYHGELGYHLWFGLQVLKHVNEHGVESSMQEDESWRRLMKKAIIDRIDMKITELDSKTNAKMTEIDSRVEANFHKTGTTITDLDSKIHTLDLKIGANFQKTNALVEQLVEQLTSKIETVLNREGRPQAGR